MSLKNYLTTLTYNSRKRMLGRRGTIFDISSLSNVEFQQGFQKSSIHQQQPIQWSAVDYTFVCTHVHTCLYTCTHFLVHMYLGSNALPYLHSCFMQLRPSFRISTILATLRSKISLSNSSSHLAFPPHTPSYVVQSATNNKHEKQKKNQYTPQPQTIEAQYAKDTCTHTILYMYITCNV